MPASKKFVTEMRLFQAAHLLVEAYRYSEERGGSIDWDDHLDQARQAALYASAT